MSHPTNNTAGRTIAIGDIHGCYSAFRNVLQRINLQPNDTLITLGDYIDRGTKSFEVVERLISLRDECHLVPLLGNHEAMLLGALQSDYNAQFWLQCGGSATMASYTALAKECGSVSASGKEAPTTSASMASDSDKELEQTTPVATEEAASINLDAIPTKHIDFFRDCALAYETETHLFLHANYDATLPIDEQDELVLLWKHLHHGIPDRHVSGKTAIVGHTPQQTGDVLDLDHMLCIDTYCFGAGYLTAIDVHTKEIWQADKNGVSRNLG